MPELRAAAHRYGLRHLLLTPTSTRLSPAEMLRLAVSGLKRRGREVPGLVRAFPFPT